MIKLREWDNSDILYCMSVHFEDKPERHCHELLVEAVKEGTTALLSKGEKAQEAAIKAGANFLGFIVCEALAQQGKPPQCKC